jgi:2-polyprenyl-3-methyl-5-hydroxy-6-metoxy-1,4-benzoquinol methylase
MLQSLTNRRAVTGEIMDSPGIDPAAHRQALQGLQRINLASGTVQSMSAPIIQLTQRAGLNRLSLLDVACGGGDVPIGVAAEVQRRGVSVDLTLLDCSATALSHASQAAAAANVACRVLQADALAGLECGEFDVITNSLFLHHVPEPDQVVGLLRTMSQLARRMVVISDLRRSRLGWLVAWTACRALSESRIVHHDGPVSVRAAWTLREFRGFAARAGMTNARIEYCWPWRMQLIWEPSGGGAA